VGVPRRGPRTEVRPEAVPQDTGRQLLSDNSCLEDWLKPQFAQPRARHDVIGVSGESCQGWADQVLDSCRDACILSGGG
jgi:hypothetical protein